MAKEKLSAIDIEAAMNAQFDAWFAELQKLSSVALNPDDWGGRWFDYYSPADALAAGPERDDE